jgi:hypothetical protein
MSDPNPYLAAAEAILQAAQSSSPRAELERRVLDTLKGVYPYSIPAHQLSRELGVELEILRYMLPYLHHFAEVEKQHHGHYRWVPLPPQSPP